MSAAGALFFRDYAKPFSPKPKLEISTSARGRIHLRPRTDSRPWGLTGSFGPDFSFPVEISKCIGLRAGPEFPRFRETPKWLKSRCRPKSDATFQGMEDNGPEPPTHFGRIVEISKNAELRPGVSVYDISRNLKVAQSSKSPKIGRAPQRTTGDRPGALANFGLPVEISKNTGLRARLTFTRARKTSNRPKFAKKFAKKQAFTERGTIARVP